MCKLTIKKIKDHYGIFCGDNLLSTGDTYEECEEDLKEMENHSDCSLNKEKNDVEVKANTENLSPVKITESTEDTYDKFVSLIQERYDNNNITYEQAKELNDLAYNKYVTEGANIDITKEFVKYNKKIKELKKSYAKSIKAKNYSDAKKKLTEIDGVVDEAIKSIQDIDSNIGSTIIGIILRNVETTMKIIIPCFGVGFSAGTISTLLSKKGVNDKIAAMLGFTTGAVEGSVDTALIATSGITFVIGTVVSAIDFFKDVIGIINRIKKDDEVSADSFNTYKNAIIGDLKGIKKNIKDTLKNIDKVEKAEKEAADKAKETKESADEVETVESVKPILADVTGSFAYEAMVDSINEKYNNGIITYEMASDLNDVAYNKYVTEGANIDITKIFAKIMKELLKTKKAYKKAIKAKDYSEAKKQIAKMNELLDDAISKIKGVSGGVGSTALGFLATFAYQFIKTLVPCFAISLPTAIVGQALIKKGVKEETVKLAGFAVESGTVPKALITGHHVLELGNTFTSIITVIVAVIESLKIVSETVDRIRKEKDITPDTFNTYKNSILGDLKDLKAQLKKASSNIDAVEKAEKEAATKAKEEKSEDK